MREPPPGRPADGRGGGGAGRWIGWLIAALIAAGIIVWIVLAAVDESAGPEAGATLTEIASEPEEFAGQTVTVSGQVDQLLVTPGVFTVGTADQGGVVVLPTTDASVPAGIEEGSVVQITGVVRQVNAELAEQDDFLFEEQGGDTGFLEGFEQQAAIAATQIDRTVPEEGALEQEGGQQQQQPQGGAE